MKLFKKLAISCLALLAFASFGIATACDDENVSVSSPNSSSESSESLSSSEDSSSSSTEEEVSEFVYRVTVQNATGYDHAGEFECSLLMALYPDCVDLSRLGDREHWFTKSSAKANPELGERMAKLSLEYLEKAIQ